jgi:hypothetical protein
MFSVACLCYYQLTRRKGLLEGNGSSSKLRLGEQINYDFPNQTGIKKAFMSIRKAIHR